jgi:hypothetical protein
MKEGTMAVVAGAAGLILFLITLKMELLPRLSWLMSTLTDPVFLLGSGILLLSSIGLFALFYFGGGLALVQTLSAFSRAEKEERPFPSQVTRHSHVP